MKNPTRLILDLSFLLGAVLGWVLSKALLDGIEDSTLRIGLGILLVVFCGWLTRTAVRLLVHRDKRSG